MEKLKKNIYYLKGLTDGLDLNKSSEGKAISKISDILLEMSYVLEEVIDAQLDVEDYVISLDEDLHSVENEIYAKDSDNIEPFGCESFIEYEDYRSNDCCGHDNCCDEDFHDDIENNKSIKED